MMKNDELNIQEKEETSKDDLTLAEYPLGLVSRRVPKGLKTIQYEEEVTLDGQRTRRFWQVSGSDAYGLPTGGDQDIFIAILAAWEEVGFKDPAIPVQSVYHMLKKLNLPLNRENYQRFHHSVQTLIGTTYYTENTLYDRDKKRWIHKHTFHLFEEANFLERYSASNRTMPMPFGYIRASNFLYRLVQSGDLKNISLTLYRNLPTPLARRLYRYLDKQRYYGAMFAIGLRKLCLKLGFANRAVEKYTNPELKRILTPALNSLKKEGFLTHYSYQPGKNDLKLAVAFRETEVMAAGRPLTAEQMGLAEIFAEELGDQANFAFYQHIARILPPHLLYRALSETKDAHRRDQIRTTRPRFFTDVVKRFAQEQGYSLDTH